MEIAQNTTRAHSFNKYRKTQIQWEHIPRANQPNKNLAEKTIKIISVTVPKINAQGYAIYTHAYLTKITRCKQDQNTNLLKQISHVFNIKAHKSIVIDGKKYRNVYVIKKHENTFQILDNPKVFFSEESNHISCNRVSRKSNEKKGETNKKAEKIRSSNIYNNINSFNNRSKSNFKKFNLSKKVLKLSDFTNPSEKDCDILRRSSGRQFSSNAIKEIIKDMAKKLMHVYFNCKAGFMAYMVQALKHEMRNEVKTNNTNFRIKANMTEEDKKAIEIERYLTEVENIREVSQEVHLKKKLASVLRPITAYTLLRNYRGIRITGSIAKIELRQPVELTELEKGTILAQVKATHEMLIDGMFEPIEEIKFTTPTPLSSSSNAVSTPPRIGIWGKLRAEIVSLLGNAGENLDKALFSKLDAEIDENNKQIKLKAESSFYRKFIEERYSQVIQMVAINNGYSICY